MSRRSSETLVKNTAKGDVSWTITVDKNDYSTQVETALDGGNARQCAPVAHRNITAARMYMNQQVKLKLKQGYCRSRNVRRSEPPDQDRLSEEYTGNDDYDQRNLEAGPSFRPFGKVSFIAYGTDDYTPAYGQRTESLKRKSSFHDGSPHKRRKTMEEEILLANKRADALKRREPLPSDSDTESLADSEASYSQRKRSRIGVSPLNRRRSVRLAMKRGTSLMDTVPGLSKQDTVAMSSPQVLERMETSNKWGRWRPGKRGSETTLLESQKSNEKMDTLPREESSVPKQLFRKQSTTTGLRQIFARTGLESQIDIPNVFADVPAIATENVDMNEKEEGGSKSTVMRRLGGRKSVMIMPSVDEAGTASTDTDDQNTDIGKSKAKRKTKSPATTSEGTPSAKRSKLTPKRSRGPGPKVYQPAKDLLPVNIDAQVVWRIPFSAFGKDQECCGVCFTEKGCFIGTKSGKVIKLDNSVNHVSTTELPQGIQLMASDCGRVLCACRSGKFYEVADDDWSLLQDLKNKSQVLAFDVHDTSLFISKAKGVLLGSNQHEQESWKTLTKRNFSEWVKADETGVYVGHSTGVCKYSSLDGNFIWDRTLSGKPSAGVLNDESLYVACDNVVCKLDISSGEILKTYGNVTKGKRKEAGEGKVAVGGGMVFHMNQAIRCYDEECGQLVYILNPPTPTCTQIQFYKGRIFFVGKDSVSSIDLSPVAVNNAINGSSQEPVDVKVSLEDACKASLARKATVPIRSLKRRASRDVGEGPPARKKCVLKAKVLTLGYHD